jgi:hypothetical protein
MYRRLREELVVHPHPYATLGGEAAPDRLGNLEIGMHKHFLNELRRNTSHGSPRGPLPLFHQGYLPRGPGLLAQPGGSLRAVPVPFAQPGGSLRAVPVPFAHAGSSLRAVPTPFAQPGGSLRAVPVPFAQAGGSVRARPVLLAQPRGHVETEQHGVTVRLTRKTSSTTGVIGAPMHDPYRNVANMWSAVFGVQKTGMTFLCTPKSSRRLRIRRCSARGPRFESPTSHARYQSFTPRSWR